MTSSSERPPSDPDSGAGPNRPAGPAERPWGEDLPGADGPAGDESAWDLPQPFPTSLVGLWPAEEMPRPDEVEAAFARFIGAPVVTLEEIAPEDASIRWNRVLEVPGLPSPVIVWTEPALAMGAEDLPDSAWRRHRWVLGCETMLSDQAPLDDFIALMRLVAGSFAEMPAVLDAMTRQWFQRAEIEQLFLADEPAATEDVLWRVHAVGASERPTDNDRVWLYTVGLWRCGKPELELLELPGRHMGSAVTLLNGIAALALTGPLPRPSVVAAIGENLRVAFRPWQEIAATLDADSVGSLADRRQADERGALNPLTGVRAVVCDFEPKGSFRPLWTWPEKAIRLLEDGRGALYLSERSTLQLARRARATWSDFATAFVVVQRALAAQRDAAQADPPVFLVKAGFTDRAAPERGREHLWFEIRHFHGDTVDAELLNTPQIATHLRPGDAVRIGRDVVSDWRVILPGGGFGPATAADLLEAVERYRTLS